MRVLVCDDEPAARYVSRRWLTTLLGCEVTECADGVQALEVLAQRPFDAAILDLEMPGLSGAEVVEVLRGSEALRDLPVIILSNERRAPVIRQLVDLGVAAYLLKPLREETVLGRLAPLLDRIRARGTKAAGGVRARPTLRPGEPTLLVDGDPNFSHVFTSVVAPYATPIAVESGAAALARFRQAPVQVVFVGHDLGLVTAPALVRKIREQRPDAFVVGVGYAGPDAAPFDAAIPRSYMPVLLTAEIAKLSASPGALDELEALAPGFRGCLRSAVHQVFGMMANLEVVDAVHGPASGDEAFVSTVIVSVEGQTLELDLVIPCRVAEVATERALDTGGARVEAENLESMASELANIVSGRLNSWLKEHGHPCTCALPRTQRRPIDAAPAPSEHEFADHFGVAELDAVISVRGRVPSGAAAR